MNNLYFDYNENDYTTGKKIKYAYMWKYKFIYLIINLHIIINPFIKIIIFFFN